MTVSEYYVDPVSGNDTTGDGTSGTPWKTVQHALDNITRDTTNGDRVNIKDSGDDVLTATLSNASYGTPSFGAPLVFEGYTSTAGDGGIGGIDGDGTYSVLDSTDGAFVFRNLHLHNSGSNVVLKWTGIYGYVVNCEIDNTSGDGVVVTTNSASGVIGCYVHNCGGIGVTAHRTLHNYLANGTNDFTSAIYNAQSGQPVHFGNIISIDGSSNGINQTNWGGIIANNSILSAGGTGSGIITGANAINAVYGNLVEGFSDTGGVSFDVSDPNIMWFAYNASFNSETHFESSDLGSIDNETLGSTPFAKSGSDTYANRNTYFVPNDVGNIQSVPYGFGWKGAVAPASGGGTTNNIILPGIRRIR